MICEQGVEGALPPLGNAVPEPLLDVLRTDLGLLYSNFQLNNPSSIKRKAL
jgi:hypothetical protein